MIGASVGDDRKQRSFGLPDAARDNDNVGDPSNLNAAEVAKSVRVQHGVARLVAFCFLVLLWIVIADRCIYFGLRRIETGPFGVFNRLVEGRINAEILVTGSSRALTHFDPAIMTKATGLSAFNIGINGSQTDMQVAVFKTYLSHNVKPKFVVHSLDSFSFATSHGGVYFPGQYLPYLNEPDIYTSLRTINSDFWKSKWLPLYGYTVEDMNFTWMLGLGRVLGRSPIDDRPLGFQPRYTEWTGDFDRLRASNPEGITFEVEQAGVERLEELMTECNRHGIRVILVYSPVYYEMRTLERNRGEIFSLFASIAERHHATLWDFTDSPVAFRKGNFYNSQHLNATGAAAFSAEFAGRLAAHLREVAGTGR